MPFTASYNMLTFNYDFTITSPRLESAGKHDLEITLQYGPPLRQGCTGSGWGQGCIARGGVKAERLCPVGCLCLFVGGGAVHVCLRVCARALV